VDAFSLFAANAIVLLVMAGGFLAAWVTRRHEGYWLTWIAANVALALGLLLFMAPSEGRLLSDAMPHCLLVLGFGLRWRAARQFSYGRCGWLAVLAPVCATALLFALPALFSPGSVFALVNIVLTAQAGATAWHFWRERGEALPSSIGLVLAYGVMALSFAARIGQGLAFLDAFTTYLPHDQMLEIHLLIAVVHTSASGAFVLSIAYERAARHLSNEALRDPLTGLHNRRAFEARIGELRRRQQGREFALVLFDLDHFKAVNDRHGHIGGDAALRAAAAVCADRVREPHFLARIGGEEFAAVLLGVSPEEAHAVADRIRSEIAGLDIVFEGDAIPLTVSAGIYHGIAGEKDFSGIMRAADTSLYRAKTGGRNRVEPALPLHDTGRSGRRRPPAPAPQKMPLRSAAG
jgi:diguanylate cyclase (GGDEF)-like protein